MGVSGVQGTHEGHPYGGGDAPRDGFKLRQRRTFSTAHAQTHLRPDRGREFRCPRAGIHPAGPGSLSLVEAIPCG